MADQIDWAAAAVRPSQCMSAVLVNQGKVFVSGDWLLRGISVREANSSASTFVQAFDGQDATGNPVFEENLNALQSVRDFFGGSPVWCHNGVFVVCGTGIVNVILYLVDV